MCHSCKQIWPSGEYKLFPVGMQGRHFTHLKTGQPCEDRTLLLIAILADAINLGIAKMAEACPGTTARKLDWLASPGEETFNFGTACFDGRWSAMMLTPCSGLRNASLHTLA
jgi:Tn3 transposase DDE domain-containing protein